MTSEDPQPLGPEDQQDPDRHVQTGETPAEYERDPGTGGEDRSDVEDGAWRTEATFDDGLAATPADDIRPRDDEDEDVDPIVHRGE